MFRPDSGEVVGIISSGIAEGGTTGISFAIPINWAKELVRTMHPHADALRAQAGYAPRSASEPATSSLTGEAPP